MVTKEQIESVETKSQKREREYRERRYADMYIDRRIIRSGILNKLTGTAIRAYLLFLTKRVMKPYTGGKSKRDGKGKYYIANQGEIQFTYDEAQDLLNISRQTFTAAIDQLIEVGLIDIAKSGSGLHRDVSLYAISDRWQDYGNSEKFIKKERPQRKLSYGFTKGHKNFSRQVNHTCQVKQIILEGKETKS